MSSTGRCTRWRTQGGGELPGWRAPAQVVRGAKTTAMYGELIEDPDVIADHRAPYGDGLRGEQGTAEYGPEVPGRRRAVTAEEFRQAIDENKLVAIRFTTA